MTGIELWSTTAGSNNSAPPYGAPEGMLPSAVNNVMRQNMASIRTWYESAMWTDLGNTPTYISASSFSVATDKTATYTVGRRLRLTGTTPFTVYGTILTSVYSSVTTITLKLDSGALDNTLANVSVSISTGANTARPRVAFDYATTSGSSNAYVAALTPPLAAHVIGLPILLITNFSNTGAATINFDNLGAVTIKNGGTTDVISGAISNAQAILVAYDGTNYQLISGAASGGGGGGGGGAPAAAHYLLVGAGMKANKSTDGITYTASSPSFAGGTFNVIDVVYSSVYSKFVLLGKPGSSTTAPNAVLTTTDGTSFSAPSGTNNTTFNTHTYNRLFQFSNGNIITSDQAANGVAISKDGGATFDAILSLNSGGTTVSGWAISANNGLICADGAGTYAYTTDGGATITSSVTHTGVTNAKAVMYLNGNYIVGGATGNLGYKTLVSAVALTTVTSNLTSENVVGGVWTGTTYVVYTATSVSTATSVGGTWTSRTTAFFTTASMTGNIVTMAVSDDNMYLIAVTDSGDIGRSLDFGVTWTKLSNANNPLHGTQFYGVKYIKGVFIVFGDAGKAAYSQIGDTFVSITTTGFGANAILAVAGG